MAKIVVFGNGQNASLGYFYLTHDSPHEVVAFTVDGEYIKEDTLFNLPVVPFEEINNLYPPEEYKMLVMISYRNVNRLRAEKYYQAKEKGYELISYINSKATTWPGLEIGDNCFIFENSVIHPFAEIGNNVIIDPAANIGHHSIIKDHCYVASHAVLAGSSIVEPYCFLGVNSTIRDNITVARECVVGAGSLILHDTQERGVYTCKEAKRIPYPSDELKNI